MAHAPTREQIALQHALATSSHGVVAAFLEANARKMRPFTDLPRAHYNRMIDYLHSGDDTAQEKARSRLDDSLDAITKIPTRGLKLTDGVKKHVVRAQRNDEFLALVASVRGSLRAPLKSIVAIPSNIYAVTMATLGLDRRDRAYALTGFSIPVFAGAAFNMMVAAEPAQAAVSPEPTRHTDTAPDGANLASRMGALEITVSPGRDAKHAFDTVVKIGNDRLTPELARLMKRSERARELVGMIRATAAKYNLDGDLGANQLFKETSFIEKFITGEEASPAGALGFAQIMPATGAEYGYSVADLKNPEVAVEGWGRIMSRLTQKYGDQRLAAIAYNGGGGAINFAQEKLGLDKISADQWVNFMLDRRATLGTKIGSAWHVETLEYVLTISPEYRPILGKLRESETREARAAKLGSTPLPDAVPAPTPSPALRG